MTSRLVRKGGIIFRFLLSIVLLVALGAGAAYFSLTLPYRGFEKPVILDFPRGTSTAEMGRELAQSGVIRYPWQFLAVRVLRSGARLQAGEYQFSEPAAAFRVYARIARGDVFFYEFGVPEGSNMFDIASSIDRFDFIKGADFLSAARDPALIHDIAPKAPTLEGYLFPSTYRLTRRTTVQQLCQMMTDQFRKNWRELQKGDRPANVDDIVTLASLVEKETAVPDERPMVAAVFQNRLRLGMALDCDPTTIYASMLEQRYRGTIHRSDLDSANQYNTYKHAGLPPGPIANPGVASLKAALEPTATDYLYFVAKADGSGGHQFSKSMDEHNRAVEQYRHHLNKPAAPPPPAAAEGKRKPRQHRRS
jgi:UPF0755 protein